MTSQTHVVLPGSHRAPNPHARALGKADPDEWVEVTVKLRRKESLPDVVERPEQPLTRAELGTKYGASAADVDDAEKVFKTYGLQVVESHPESRSLRLGGPVHAMEAAFDVKLIHYKNLRDDQRQTHYRGRVGSLQVPAPLQGIVVGVFGLDTRQVVRERPVKSVVTPATARRALAGSTAKAAPARPWFFPAELADAYRFPPGDGQGQCIGLLEFGGGYFPADLAAFCKAAKVTVPKVVAIAVDDTPTDSHDGAEDEVMLDIEVVAGVCPKATIAVYFGQFTEQGWIDTLDAALHDEANAPTVLSISWGLAEDDPNWSQGALELIDQQFKLAALGGITICVASGDDGSGDQVEDGHAHVDFPASSPYVLAVGGTTLRKGGAGRSEVVWKDGDGKRADGGGSGGGGTSVHFPRPAWQDVSIDSVNPGAIVGRVVPDVAADASANTGYFIVVDGKGGVNGGTSAAAPLWASLVVRINAAVGPRKRVGYLTPLLYKSIAGGQTVGAAGCTDITSGDNNTAAVGGYSATTGFDAVTGWGSPIGVELLAVLKPLL